MTSVQYWLRFPDTNNFYQKGKSQKKARAGKSAEKGLEKQVRQCTEKAAESLSSRANHTRITRSHARRTVSSKPQSNNDSFSMSYPANRANTCQQRNKQLDLHVIDTENPPGNNSSGKQVQKIATDSSRTDSSSPSNKTCSCETCQCRFPSKKDLERHGEAFCCSVCGQLLSTKSAVRLHIDMIHKGLKPFSCDICQKSFALRKHLRGHVNAVHKRLQPFTCNFCQQKFSRKDNLKTHENSVHLQGKKFSCLICSESFTLKHNLKSHISEVHDKIKPFSCNVCQKSFARKYHLKIHLNSHKHTG